MQLTSWKLSGEFPLQSSPINRATPHIPLPKLLSDWDTTIKERVGVSENLFNDQQGLATIAQVVLASLSRDSGG